MVSLLLVFAPTNEGVGGHILDPKINQGLLFVMGLFHFYCNFFFQR